MNAKSEIRIPKSLARRDLDMQLFSLLTNALLSITAS